MDLREKIAEALYEPPTGASGMSKLLAEDAHERRVTAVMEVVEQQQEEIARLRHDLAVARGETIGSVPSWEEYAEQERLREAEAARYRPKPHLTLEEAREMAALERARENGDTT